MIRAWTCSVPLAVLSLLAIPSSLLRQSAGQGTEQGGGTRPAAAVEGGSTSGQVEGTRSEGATSQPRRRLRVPDAGQLIADAVVPVDEMIRQNGFAFRASHFAEDCRDWPAGGYAYNQAHVSAFAFAVEAVGGRASEYCVCAARGPDGQCGLYVSVCDYHIADELREGGVLHQVVIDQIRLVKPDTLSLKLRAEMMDELNAGSFLSSYRAYLRAHPEGAREDTVVRPWMNSGGTEDA